MQLQAIDLSIIGLYLASTVVIGIYLKRRAAKNLRAYFQGGRKLPWYMLGLSNASGMFDISGTMWLVTLAFVYGLKSVWIPWLWPVFNQIFLAVYLSTWLRRSNVITGAEWIQTRFGNDRGGQLAHLVEGGSGQVVLDPFRRFAAAVEPVFPRLSESFNRYGIAVEGVIASTAEKTVIFASG